MEPRIEIVTPCEHGMTRFHLLTGVAAYGCGGGSRLVYTREEAAAKFVEWGDELVMDDALVLVDVLLGVGE